jgi:glycosyltransferase involved in cell wall biosynthesis
VRRFLRQHRVSVALGEFLDQFLDFIPLLRRLNIPFVVQAHGIDVSASLRLPELRAKYLAYEWARAVLTRSEFHRRRLISIGIPEHKIHVNPGGVDIPTSTSAREPKAAKRFLSIGRLATKKGPIYLLEAFRLAAAEDTEIELDVIGNGILFPAVRQFVNACGLQDRVRLHGHASEALKKQLLTECGVLVQHSITDPDTGDEEGLPAATQEAMAHAMAVVSTHHAGIPEAVVHGETGLLVAEGDASAMSEAMLNVIQHASKFGAEGRRKAEKLYSWSAERSRLLSHLGIETT